MKKKRVSYLAQGKRKTMLRATQCHYRNGLIPLPHFTEHCVAKFQLQNVALQHAVHRFGAVRGELLKVVLLVRLEVLHQLHVLAERAALERSFRLLFAGLKLVRKRVFREGQRKQEKRGKIGKNIHFKIRTSCVMCHAVFATKQ